MKIVLLCLFFVSCVFSQQWDVLVPNVMTLAIGASAPDDQTIYVSGANDGSGAAILKSSDAGATWVSLPHDPQMMYMDVDVAPGTTFGVAPGIGIFGLVSGASFTNDGEVFQSTPEPLFVSASQSATAVDANTYYMVGFWQRTILDDPHDGVMASFDGGRSQKYFDWGVETQARYGAFPSNSTWFISGGTWPAEKSRAAVNGVYQLSPRITLRSGSVEIDTNPSAMGSAEGYLGVIARTTDGGNSWRVVYNDTNRFYFNGISCANTQQCWAVAEGPDGAWILNSNNGGETWTEQYFLTLAGLFDIKMIDPNNGWAVGAVVAGISFNALFLLTNDGGRTWTNQNTVNNAWPNSITVVSLERAYATAFLRSGLSSILAYQ